MDFADRIPDAGVHDKKSLELFAGTLGSGIGNFDMGLAVMDIGAVRGEGGGAYARVGFGIFGAAAFCCMGYSQW